jgi:hypothetical protein
MFGTITLKGVQNKNKFVDEIVREWHLINSWVDMDFESERYILIRKFNDSAWYVLRYLELNRYKKSTTTS